MLSRPSVARPKRSCRVAFLRAVVPKSHNAGAPLAQNSSTQKQSRRIARLSSFSKSLAPGKVIERCSIGKRLNSTSASPPPEDVSSNRREAIFSLVDKINQHQAELAELLDELGLDRHSGVPNDEAEALNNAFAQVIGQRNQRTLEEGVRSAKQQYGDSLPEGLLNATEMQLYTRLYGEPIPQEEDLSLVEEEDRTDSGRMFRKDEEGHWEEVDYEPTVEYTDDISLAYDMEVDVAEEESLAMRRTREVAEQLGGQIILEEFEEEAVPGLQSKLHPLTEAGKFETNPSTVFLPKDTVIGPISVILSDFSNKHISETAHRIFGGLRLPHSTTTPPLKAQLPQLPIPLEASQHHMSEMEANAYIAALYPGIYASVLSVLVEVRKRLGTQWLRNLIAQGNGPNVLDAGGGGAGILAWRDVLRAEWQLMDPDQPDSAPIPFGRATVLTGSETLKLRASAMLENTTFLPRLPDYVHVRSSPTLDDERPPPKRKQYDVIIAPHTLLAIEDDYLRKEHVQNLWALLNPDGGVLILLEKGRQRGFEAIAGAREMLLKRHISHPSSTQPDDLEESTDGQKNMEKEAGMIVAPCTNHETCPMYTIPGKSKGREDYCHFQQRYIRPPFLQRIIGAKDKNHEDVKFSYIAVQRGIDLRERHGIVQGREATDSAFEGFENLADQSTSNEAGLDDADTASTENMPTQEVLDAANKANFHTLSLPRAVYPPMKRRGHVIFDFCTPAGKIERWTVPRSFSRQAYRDARKARWGDLWALGAKTRVARNLSLGDKLGEGKKERLARRAAASAALSEHHDELDDLQGEEKEEVGSSAEELAELSSKKKHGSVPSWKKHADKKKIRQASKKISAKQLAED